MNNERQVSGWGSPRENTFLANVSILQDTLTPAMYECCYDNRMGYFLEKINCHDQKLIKIVGSNSELVIKDIENFWAREAVFRKYCFPYKRGILLYGPPGGGKSSTIALVCAAVIENGGYVLKFGSLGTFMPCIKMLKKIHPNCKVVVLMEDLDQIIYEENVSSILNLLDGVEQTIDNVVWLATTNAPEKLEQNIKNRPSRFDRRFEFKNPDLNSRLTYIVSLFKGEDAIRFDMERWAKDSEGFSFAHIKELFISVVIFGNDYDEAVKELKNMGEMISSKKEKDDIDD